MAPLPTLAPTLTSGSPGIAANFVAVDWIYAEDFFESVLNIRDTQLKDFSSDYIPFRIPPSADSAPLS